MSKKEHTFANIQDFLINNGWGKDCLSETFDSVFCNIGKSFIDLKAHFQILTEAKNALADVTKLCEYKDEAGMIVLSLTGRVMGCFVCACQLALSGQLSETYVLMRACLENALYAFYINESPDYAKVWSNRHKSEDSKKACRDLFSVGKIFRCLEQKSKIIKDNISKSYEEAIDWGAHPNERSVFPNLVPKETGDGFRICFINCDPDFMRACVVRLACCMLSILELYELVFQDVMTKDKFKRDISIFKSHLLPLLQEMQKRFADRKRSFLQPPEDRLAEQ